MNDQLEDVSDSKMNVMDDFITKRILSSIEEEQERENENEDPKSESENDDDEHYGKRMKR